MTNHPNDQRLFDRADEILALSCVGEDTKAVIRDLTHQVRYLRRLFQQTYDRMDLLDRRLHPDMTGS